MAAFLRQLPQMTPQQYKDRVARAPPDEDMDMGGDQVDHHHAHEHEHSHRKGNQRPDTVRVAHEASCWCTNGRGLAYDCRPMHRAFRLHPTTRRRFAWLVAFLLLWQQVAIAAYACTVAPPTAQAMAMHTGDGAAMHEACPSMVDMHANGQALCQAHCQPDHATQPDGRAGSVPPSLFAALPPAWPPRLQAMVADRPTSAWLHRLRAPPHPASLLFCSLLI
jgi:hypothetical protein